MPTIRNIHNSFVQFAGDIVEGSNPERDICFSGCDDTVSVCLPLHDITDVAFQILLIDSDAPFRSDLGVGLYNGTDCPEEITDSELIESWTGGDLQFIEITQSIYLLIFDVEEALNLCDELEDGACLKLVIFDASENVVWGCSNCFTFAENTCYTKQLKYGNLEDAFGFYYDLYTTFYNRIRLRITTHSPKFPTEKRVFRLSDGSYKRLSAVMAKEYDSLLDYMDENMHQSMAVALQHDLFYLYNDETKSYEKRMEDEDAEYDIDWNEEPGHYTGLAQASVKLKVDPFYNENSNC